MTETSPDTNRKDGNGKDEVSNITTIQKRIKLLEENEKKLREELTNLENHRKSTEANLIATIGGLSELKNLLPKEEPKPNVKSVNQTGGVTAGVVNK